MRASRDRCASTRTPRRSRRRRPSGPRSVARYPPRMDPRRVRKWDWLTGLGGLVLLASLFLPWYSLDGVSATGWESFSVIDLLLAVAALCAIALPIVTAMQRTAAVPQSF